MHKNAPRLRHLSGKVPGRRWRAADAPDERARAAVRFAPMPLLFRPMRDVERLDANPV
jgi:hypothetical protein